MEATKQYRLKGNPVTPVPVIGNLTYDRLGQEVIAKVNERFKGIKNLEFTQKFRKDVPITHSNTPRALAMDEILMEITDGEIRVLNPVQVVAYWDAIPDKSSTYADTNSVSVFPKEGRNEGLRQKVLRLAGKTSTRVPLTASGLHVVKDNGDLGFTFEKTDYMEIRKAPWLKEDGKVKFDPSSGDLVSSDEGVAIWTPSSQSSLWGLFRNGDDDLNSWDDGLLSANDRGRVQIIQGPKGLAEKLQELIANLQKEKDSQLAEINSRFEKANRLLRTGSL